MTLIFKLYFRVSSRCGIKSYVTDRQTDIFHLDYLTMLTLNIFKITMVILHYPEENYICYQIVYQNLFSLFVWILIALNNKLIW